MKVFIIYNSKTGFTKRYVDWIAEEISCSILAYTDFDKTTIEASDMVIFCSRVHIGKIEYLNKVKPHFHNQSKGNFIVVATGATPATAEETINKIWENNFTETELKTIPHFYLQGGINYEKLGFVDRTIMKIVSMLMSLTKDKTEEEVILEQAIKSSQDFSSKEYIMPLVDFVNESLNKV